MVGGEVLGVQTVRFLGSSAECLFSLVDALSLVRLF